MRFPPGGALGIRFINRSAKDVFNPSHTQYVGADYFHKWSPRFTGYALASTGTGAPYPARQLYLEGQFLISKGLTLQTGAGASSIPTIGIVRSLKFGATYYRGDGYASLTYTPAWSQALGSTQAFLFSLALGHLGKTTETFYLGTGNEGDVSLENPANPSIVGERETGAALFVKHWVSTGSGFRAGIEGGTLYRPGGRTIYARRAVTVGIFTSLGQ